MKKKHVLAAAAAALVDVDCGHLDLVLRQVVLVQLGLVAGQPVHGFNERALALGRERTLAQGRRPGV